MKKEDFNIREGNKLIVEFIGLKYGWFIHQEKPLTKDKKTFCDVSASSFLGSRVYYIHDLKFNSSWDWLMPVVEKIESMHKTDDKFSDNYVLFSKYRNNKKVLYYCNIFSSEDRQHNGESSTSKIESVWLAVVEFIKWYNQNK